MTMWAGVLAVLVTVAGAEVEVVTRGREECGGLQCGDTCLHPDKDTPHLTTLPTTNVNILLTGDFFNVDFHFIETCSMIYRYGVKCHLCFESRLKSNIRFITAIIIIPECRAKVGCCDDTWDGMGPPLISQLQPEVFHVTVLCCHLHHNLN